MLFLWGLQDFRDLLKSPISNKWLESLQADMPVANVRVPINARAELLFRIIQMQDFDPIHPNRLVNLPCKFAVMAVTEIIPGGEEMGGIKTNAQSLRISALIDNTCQMFKFISQ